MRKYPTYKLIGVDWLGEIPSGWYLEKLKFKSNIQFSNVDKLSEESETPVLLCNYIDVYKNEKIHSGIDFMQATANVNEIKKFKIKRGDVIITKDSESVNDIAVPALVVENFENVLCGYHLAQIKVQKDLTSEYLFRLFQSKDFNQNFESSASGMTRYGLSVYSIKNVVIPIPPLPEQHSIVRFLDYKTRQIDSFVANRQKQIELLEEQKAGIINKAVTKGTYPNVKMKPSGIEWIGEIPKHWEIWKVSRLYKKIGSGTTPKAGTPEYYENGTIPWINTGDLNDGILEDCGTRITEKAFADHSTLKMYKNGTLLIAMYGATIAKLSILNFNACTNQACCALVDSKLIKLDFAFNWFLSQKQNIINLSYGGGQPNISQDVVRSIRIPMPPKEEQQSIIEFIKSETSTIDSLIAKYQKQIDLMQEYRASLISQTVTGKIDVREWQPKAKKYRTEQLPISIAAEK